MKEMHKKSMYKAIVAIAVALAFIMPVAAFANDEESTNNFEIVAEMDSTDMCPLLCYNAEYIDVTPDTSILGILGDKFYAYNSYDPTHVLWEGPVYFDSENPGDITLLKKTTSGDFIAGATWAEDTWYGCEYGTGKLYTIDEVTGDMTLIGGGGTSLNGLAYDPTTSKMYGASSTDLYTVNMSNGNQAFVGPFNTGGLMIGIAFDVKGTLYGEDLNDNLYSINPLTGATTLIGPLGININWAQDMAYDITWNVLYLSAFTVTPEEGALYTCNVTTGKATKVGTFQGGAEITGFAIAYTPSQPPEPPERPDGPTEGTIGIEYTFSTSTTDPEGENISYLWDWGDETSSEWLGPFNSGATVYASHTWAEAESYEIKVKARDNCYRQSDWSDTKIIHILDTPILEIGNISGGLFKVSAVIKNSGGVATTGVNWSITLDGGFILSGKETWGKIVSIPAGEEKTVSSSLILGFGKTVVTVAAEKLGVSSDAKEQEAFVLLFLIKI